MTPRIAVCCGLGGVGKTTVAAAMAVGYARAGHQVIVLTIDPARRLADALGLGALGHDPRPVSLAEIGYDGPGSLHATMLDRTRTFDEVVTRFAPDPDTAKRLLANRYYRAISERLGGAQEYMATERLYQLCDEGRWDVVIVDTPPAQQALDFFKAPDRVRRVFDRSVLRVLVQPSRGLMAATSRRVARLVRRLVGGAVLVDIGEFFRLLSGLTRGFRERSEAVRALLRSEHTGFYLVAAASAPGRAGAVRFLAFLREEGLRCCGFLVNRAAPDPEVPPGFGRADLPPPPSGVDPAAWDVAMGRVLALVATARSERKRQLGAARVLTHQDPSVPLWLVPEHPGDVRSLHALSDMGDHLPPHASATSDGAPARG